MGTKTTVPLTMYGKMHLTSMPTGDYSRDCETGKSLAAGLLASSSRDNDPHLIGEVVRAIVSQQRFSAIEVGFFSIIGATLVKANEQSHQHYLSLTKG